MNSFINYGFGLVLEPFETRRKNNNNDNNRLNLVLIINSTF